MMNPKNLFKQKTKSASVSSGTTTYAFASSPDTTAIVINGQRLDERKLLRDLEGDLRIATDMPQISVELMSDLLTTHSVSVKYDAERGYVVLWYPMLLVDRATEEEQKCRDYVTNYIKKHARENNIEPKLPLLPEQVIGIKKEVNIDRRQSHLEAVAHDGGRLIIFYTDSRRTSFYMLKQIPALHIVHIQFEGETKYTNYMEKIEIAGRSLIY